MRCGYWSKRAMKRSTPTVDRASSDSPLVEVPEMKAHADCGRMYSMCVRKCES